ncbi:hypothetical protein L7H23_07985 [Sphingopyxis sp. BSN-002]|uniref:P-loop ATPase, Sll1717 family n=1 Tax=Sphingopyxis sp. BSN-002 TaxID=2911495 RepID=UPI001EDAEA8F|nr:hypothetical protein [Sphingopyxis sp. BSN-002]UKK86030.1 hypothetical protein L7H23_07985 [Sphingopyxis sp. BSN-002]
MQIVGLRIDDEVRRNISECELLIADITYNNFNVLYEIGYAAALGKPIIPTLNSAVSSASRRVNDLGIMDTIGWATYTNGEDLVSSIEAWDSSSWRNRYQTPKNHSQPLFILDCLMKTDFRNQIFSTVENSKVLYRAFDPTQVPRLTAAQAISEISSSSGVIIPIISEDISDNYKHNLRAAFLIGLCHGFDIDCLAIQYENNPAPIDYRDFITNSTFRRETVNHVEQICADTLIRNQQISKVRNNDDAGIIAEISLGSPVAEYETQQLELYFIKTAQYANALRAEGAVITGRKGSGKSAIYFQLLNQFSKDKESCVVDLRPASHNLSEMRESLLSVSSVGIFDHTIASFWHYVMLLEILLKIREAVLPKSKNNFDLQERIRSIEENFGLHEAVVAGDFTSRLRTAVDQVISGLGGARNGDEVRQQITNLMFENPIPKLREAITSFGDIFDKIIILVDDLDKGWPPLQVEMHDVATIRHLIETLSRIRRDLGKKGLDVRHMIFLRSDVYERLVEHTSDRGKYNVIRIDWSDPQQLEHLIKTRVLSNVPKERSDDAWGIVNRQISPTLTSIDKMIEVSLRRPRFLIDVMERTLSFAINRGHGFITEDDVEEGARQMSLYLVSDFAYEMRDIAGTPDDIFYSFIGTPPTVKHADVLSTLGRIDLAIPPDQVIELLLWYGFLGILDAAGLPVFIYDRAYDIRRLEAERGPISTELRYAINPAFLKGLSPK